MKFLLIAFALISLPLRLSASADEIVYLKISGKTTKATLGAIAYGDSPGHSSYDCIEFRVVSPSKYAGNVVEILVPTDYAEFAERIRKQYGEDLVYRWSFFRKADSNSTFLVEKEKFAQVLRLRKKNTKLVYLYANELVELEIKD